MIAGYKVSRQAEHPDGGATCAVALWRCVVLIGVAGMQNAEYEGRMKAQQEARAKAGQQLAEEAASAGAEPLFVCLAPNRCICCLFELESACTTARPCVYAALTAHSHQQLRCIR